MPVTQIDLDRETTSFVLLAKYAHAIAAVALDPSPLLVSAYPLTESGRLPDARLSHSLQALKARHGSGQKDFEELSRWFEIALNNMGRGLSMFDAEQRLILCNKRYREIFSLPEALTRPGTSFADIIRYHVKSETGSERPEDIENERKWIANHVGQMRLGKSFSSTRHLKDGRTILVSNQPLPDGGWVDLQEDYYREMPVREQDKLARTP